MTRPIALPVDARLIQRYLPANPNELRLIADIQNYEWLRARNLRLQIAVPGLAAEEKMEQIVERFPHYSSGERQSVAEALGMIDQAACLRQLHRELSMLDRLIGKAEKQVEFLLYRREFEEAKARLEQANAARGEAEAA